MWFWDVWDIKYFNLNSHSRKFGYYTRRVSCQKLKIKLKNWSIYWRIDCGSNVMLEELYVTSKI